MVDDNAQIRHTIRQAHQAGNQSRIGICTIHHQPSLGNQFEIGDHGRIIHARAQVAFPQIPIANTQEKWIRMQTFKIARKRFCYGIEIANHADQVIDTSRLGVHDLRDLINRRADPRERDRLSLLFESFGFKYGIPGDADFVFDARSLPNPYWDKSLRPLNGRDAAVIRFLEQQPGVRRYIEDVAAFLEARIPTYRESARRYLTVAVGCTGGQHRSVYITERLAERFARSLPEVSVRHAALTKAVT